MYGVSIISVLIIIFRNDYSIHFLYHSFFLFI